VEMDRKYHLPKLGENTKRLEGLRQRLAAENATTAARKESHG